LTVNALVGRNTLQFSGAGTSDSYGLLIDDARLIRGSSNIVINGGFELPNVASWGLFTDISGWRGYEIEIGKGNAVYGLIGSGSNQVCELDGNRNYQITQTFLFDSLFNLLKDDVAACPDPFPGQSLKYRLEFDWAVRTVGSSNYDTSKANVLWNDFVVGSLQYNGFTGVSHASFDIVLKAGQNTLQFDGTSFSDGYGITIDNVRVFSIYNSTNLVVNGDFSLPNVGSGWQYFANGQIPGWSAVTGEVGYYTHYNPSWTSGQVLELDSTSNQRYTLSTTFFYSKLSKSSETLKLLLQPTSLSKTVKLPLILKLLSFTVLFNAQSTWLDLNSTTISNLSINAMPLLFNMFKITNC
jgi:hypothetical protein